MAYIRLWVHLKESSSLLKLVPGVEVEGCLILDPGGPVQLIYRHVVNHGAYENAPELALPRNFVSVMGSNTCYTACTDIIALFAPSLQ